MVGKDKKTTIQFCIIGICCILIAAIMVSLYFFKGEKDTGVPTLALETPRKLSASKTEEFSIAVTISDLGDVRYPAMSMSIGFDATRLEFLGISEGNLFVLNDESNMNYKLPDWNCNVQASNETGQINIMYLDMTGGRHAFTKELLQDNYNVVLHLQFRLRGSIRPGDVLTLALEDAVFAASDERQSLAMTTDTLKVKNSKLVIGD